MNNIRKANKNDSKLIFDYILKMAKYEKLEHMVSGDYKLIEKWVFEEKKAEVIIITHNNIDVGFALYFYNFSTFVTKPGLYLEDIFILEEYRGLGLGKNVFNYLVKKAKAEELERIEWVCLDWNLPSIKFYEKLGARKMDDWTVFRLDKDAINNF
ncbi:GNAT family N-acetyltransferase [Haploplasma modicum]|jgi:GNAT superfamily N-acetyltransferase|uniref:GNAT family N-acetyltransferase n=1 Tax=Haploplasma modicum TaxID=2150 RepID=UPI0004786C80|nr:GNAT family N-acetyltransferase [Haploplasma modicum]MCR1809200.1 GNAT family N-acetyltransferase [Haploplasma modicum]